MTDDDLLMEQINHQADLADKNREQFMDLRALAITLNSHFDHRTEEDILDQLRTVFRAKGLFWKE